MCPGNLWHLYLKHRAQSYPHEEVSKAELAFAEKRAGKAEITAIAVH